MKRLNKFAEDLLSIEDTFARYLSHILRARHQALANATEIQELALDQAHVIIDFKM